MLLGNLASTFSAAPSTAMRARRYFHGTQTLAAANAILRDDVIKPGVEPQAKRTKASGWQTPVAGKTYVTASLEYATIYALGGHFMGYKPPSWIKTDLTGFLFVVDGAELVDVQPDEDSIGAMLSARNSILIQRANPHLTPYEIKDPAAPDWLDVLARRYVSNGVYLRAVHGESVWQTRAGHTLLRRLTDAQKLELIELGAHVAHTGPLRFSQAWKIDKRRSAELAQDASNFFEIAERVR